jgi:phosphomannomutase/phosphoglucomutase
MVTASHNPPQYNGVKVIAADGVEVPREAEREIEEIFFSQRWRLSSWKSLVYDARPWPDVIDEYVDAIVSAVDAEKIRSRGYRVVVDAANSVGALATPRVLQKLGVKVYTVNGDLNPLFPGREPEPTPETLRETRRIVREIGADLGVGHDGDADRAIIIDDIIDTAGTIVNAARAIKEKGAKEVYAACTHPVFSGPAIDRLSKAVEDGIIKEVVVTDTIPLQKSFSGVKVLSVAETIAEAIKRIHFGESITDMFED